MVARLLELVLQLRVIEAHAEIADRHGAKAVNHMEDMKGTAELPGQLPSVTERGVGRVSKVCRYEDVLDRNHVS